MIEIEREKKKRKSSETKFIPQRREEIFLQGIFDF